MKIRNDYFTIYDLLITGEHTCMHIPPLKTWVYTPACDVVAPLGLRVYASYGDHSPSNS